MPDKVSQSRSWWKLVLTGPLAFVLGLAAVILLAPTMFQAVLEPTFAKDSTADRQGCALFIIAGIAAIVIGIAMTRWVFTGAVPVGAIVGIAASARGVSLFMSGLRERINQFDEERKLASGGRAVSVLPGEQGVIPLAHASQNGEASKLGSK